jgi:hypothetical protein
MQSWPEASDLSARIAEVRAAGAALEELRMQVIQVGRQGADIASDTRWRSHAMSAYEQDVGDWRAALADLSAELTVAGDAVDRIVKEMVVTDLLRLAGPGMVAAR